MKINHEEEEEEEKSIVNIFFLFVTIETQNFTFTHSTRMFGHKKKKKNVHILLEFLSNKNLSKTQFRTEWTNDINS